MRHPEFFDEYQTTEQTAREQLQNARQWLAVAQALREPALLAQVQKKIQAARKYMTGLYEG